MYTVEYLKKASEHWLNSIVRDSFSMEADKLCERGREAQIEWLVINGYVNDNKG